MAEANIHNDEASLQDKLERTRYAKALARLAESCDTPLVIGIYGSWGIGKTTLMKLIEANLDEAKARTVWFDPWLHQFNESPVLSLLHTMVDRFDIKEEAKKLLLVISMAFSSILLKSTTTLNLKDVDALGKRYEEERFQVRQAQIRLREHFQKIVEKAQQKRRSSNKFKKLLERLLVGKNETESKIERRIVFFIDDLDRCMPSNVLSMLEGLKLYLNLPGCVYFLGVDRQILEQSIQYKYKDIEISETSYLDKIVQLPFTIPPISTDSIEDFINPFLYDELKQCQELLVKGLGDNPRQVKRFVNTLSLNHQLIKDLNVEDYDPRLLSLILLIQYRNKDLYRLLVNQPSLLTKLREENDNTKFIYSEYLSSDRRLREAISCYIIPEGITLDPYIYLTQVARVTEDFEVKEGEIDLKTILFLHRQWLESHGEEGAQADFTNKDLTGAQFQDAQLSSSIFYQANVSGSNFAYANLEGADFGKADLRGSNFSAANLAGANLAQAHLGNSLLNDANLKNARLIYSHLGNAKLQGAILEGADLRGALLRGTSLSERQSQSATMDEEPVL